MLAYLVVAAILPGQVPTTKERIQAGAVQPKNTAGLALKLKSTLYINVCTAVPSPNGSYIAVTTEDRKVRLIDAATSKSVTSFAGPPDPAFALAFSPDGKRLAVGDERGRIWVMDPKSGKKLVEFTRVNTHIRGIQCLSYNNNGKQILSTGKDDVLILWDATTGKPLRKYLGKGANVYSARFVPGGGLVVIPTLGNGLRIAKSGDYSTVKALDGHGGQGVLDAAVDKKATRVLTAGRDNNAVLWDLKSKKRLNSLRGHTDWIWHCAISPCGRLAVTSSADRTTIVWDLRTMKPATTLYNQMGNDQPVFFTADGKYLITVSDMLALQIQAVNLPKQPVAKGKSRTKARTR